MTARKKAPARKTAKKKATKQTASKKKIQKKTKKKAAKKKAPTKKTTRTAAKKAAAKKPPRRKVGRGRKPGGNLDQLMVDLIVGTATDVHRDILKHGKPDLTFPIRSLKNVSYSTKRGYFEIGKQRKTRTLTVNTVKSFAQTLRMMGLSKDLVETNDWTLPPADGRLVAPHVTRGHVHQPRLASTLAYKATTFW